MFSNPRLVGLTVFIMFVIFTFLGISTFFRHDDWLILGNAINFLPQDWSLLWDNRLYFSPTRLDVWFFRPFFKLGVWGVYQVFKLNHSYWIVFQFLIFVLTVFLGAACFKKPTKDSKKSDWFAMLSLVFLCSYFANVVWIGEGMMNIPQLFLLILSLFLFLRGRKLDCFLSLICYVFSLGFKESAVFFPLFLSAVDLNQPTKRVSKVGLGSFYGVMSIYLIWRLGFIPLNPGYRPQLTIQSFIRPLCYFAATLVIPWLAFLANGSRLSLQIIKRKSSWFLMCGFFLLSISPHLGHPFFSPGWLLLPGFFSVWVLIWMLDDRYLNALPIIKTSLICLGISVVPIFWQSYQLSWFAWAKSQKAIHEYLKNFSDESISFIEIESCPDPSRPNVTFERVIGGTESLEHLWRIYHPKPVTFRVIPCSGASANATPSERSSPLIKWNFPDATFHPEMINTKD